MTTSGSIAQEPSCGQWTTFLDDLKQIIWSLNPEPFFTRLYFLNAAQVAPALGGSASFQSGASVTPLNADLVIFGDGHPGDDTAIEEKRRAIAALDVPRPEMIISAWVLQNSSTDSRFVGNFNDIVQRTVAENNDALQEGLFAAWTYLKELMSHPDYFDPTFHRYVVGRFAANLPVTEDPVKDVLANRSGVKFSYSNERPAAGSSTARDAFGYCKANEYCLGYTDIFSLLQPRLTDLLIGLIAAEDAKGAACEAAYALEHPPVSSAASMENLVKGKTGSDVCDAIERLTSASTEKEKAPEKLQSDLKHMLDLRGRRVPDTCETMDLNGLISETHYGKTVSIELGCFRKAIEKGLLDSNAHNGPISPVGLVRAALADFLFNYKMSQQYPHEFTPYDLTRSANDLNSALRPFVDAFSEDVIVYQRYLGARLQVEVNDFNKLHRSWAPWLKDKPFFVNNGIVTVRTISGQSATVDATSQSFLDASSAPQVSDLAQAILGLDQGNNSAAATPAAAPAAPAGIGRLAENISPNQTQLILAALSTYQNSKIQIGRDLSLTVSPRSLSGAASSEIQATLNAAETAAPNYYGGPHSGSAVDLSRVAQHKTSTRVRVDSVKLFEVSSFSAVLQRAHSRVPLLPPLVEIPYVGTLVGVPLPPASEYHSSTAFLTALTIPTAADLTAGLTFRTDQVVDGDNDAGCVWPGEAKEEKQKGAACRLRRAISLRDLNDEPVPQFHRAMIHCLATEGVASSFTISGSPNRRSCEGLSFQDVLH